MTFVSWKAQEVLTAPYPRVRGARHCSQWCAWLARSTHGHFPVSVLTTQMRRQAQRDYSVPKAAQLVRGAARIQTLARVCLFVCWGFCCLFVDTSADAPLPLCPPPPSPRPCPGSSAVVCVHVAVHTCCWAPLFTCLSPAPEPRSCELTSCAGFPVTAS